MKYNLDIKTPSSSAWLDAVMSDFNAFLQDHADCERKASSMAMSFVAKYPDRLEIIPELIETAVEELDHFQQVYSLMQQRGISLKHQIPEDLYVKRLIKKCHSDPMQRFLDRLLIASVVETRGAERFKMIADNIEDPILQIFYKQLWTSEAKHGNIFVKMALHYFDYDQVYKRLRWWIDTESEILHNLEIKAALH